MGHMYYLKVNMKQETHAKQICEHIWDTLYSHWKQDGLHGY